MSGSVSSHPSQQSEFAPIQTALSTPEISLQLSLSWLKWNEIISLRCVSHAWKSLVDCKPSVKSCSSSTSNSSQLLLWRFNRCLNLDTNWILRWIRNQHASNQINTIQFPPSSSPSSSSSPFSSRELDGATHLWFDCSIINFPSLQTTTKVTEEEENKATATKTANRVWSTALDVLLSMLSSPSLLSFASSLHSLNLGNASLLPSMLVDPQLPPNTILTHLSSFKHLRQLDLSDRMMSEGHLHQIWNINDDHWSPRNGKSPVPCEIDWSEFKQLTHLRLDRCSAIMPTPSEIPNTYPNSGVADDAATPPTTSSSTSLQSCWRSLARLSELQYLSLVETDLNEFAWKLWQEERAETSTNVSHKTVNDAGAAIETRLFPSLKILRIGGNGLNERFWDCFMAQHSVRSQLLCLDAASIGGDTFSNRQIPQHRNNRYSASFFSRLPTHLPNLKQLVLGKTAPNWEPSMQVIPLESLNVDGSVAASAPSSIPPLADADDCLTQLSLHSSITSLDLSQWGVDDFSFKLLLNPEANEIQTAIEQMQKQQSNLTPTPVQFLPVSGLPIDDESGSFPLPKALNAYFASSLHPSPTVASPSPLDSTVRAPPMILTAPISRSMMHLDLTQTYVNANCLPLLTALPALRELDISCTYITAAEALVALLPNCSTLRSLKCIQNVKKSSMVPQIEEVDWALQSALIHSNHAEDLLSIEAAAKENRLQLEELVIETHCLTDEFIHAAAGGVSNSNANSLSSSAVVSKLHTLRVVDTEVMSQPRYSIFPYTVDVDMYDFGFQLATINEDSLQTLLKAEQDPAFDRSQREALRAEFVKMDAILEQRRRMAAQEQKALQTNEEGNHAHPLSTHFLSPFANLTNLTLDTQLDLPMEFISSLDRLQRLSCLHIKHVRSFDSTHFMQLTSVPSVQRSLEVLDLSICSGYATSNRWSGVNISSDAFQTVTKLTQLKQLFVDGFHRIEDEAVLALFQQPPSEQSVVSDERPRKQMKLDTSVESEVPSSKQCFGFSTRSSWRLPKLTTLSITNCRTLSRNFVVALSKHARLFSLQLLPCDISLVHMLPISIDKPCDMTTFIRCQNETAKRNVR